MTTKVTTNLIDQSGNLALSGANVSLGAVGNLHITGGSNGQAIITDGSGNLSFSDPGANNTSIRAQAMTMSILIGG